MIVLLLLHAHRPPYAYIGKGTYLFDNVYRMCHTLHHRFLRRCFRHPRGKAARFPRHTAHPSCEPHTLARRVPPSLSARLSSRTPPPCGVHPPTASRPLRPAPRWQDGDAWCAEVPCVLHGSSPTRREIQMLSVYTYSSSSSQ